MSVYKDGKTNTWRVIYRYTDWKGEKKQTQKRGFQTKREAQAWEREQLNKIAGDLDMNFASFIETYSADMKSRIKENTWHTKEHIIRTKILPYFSSRPINEIQPKDIIAWQNEMINSLDNHGKPYSPVYLKTLHNQLSAIFNHAVKFYGLSSNPAAKVGNMGKAKSKEMQFWTQDEYKKFSYEMMDKPVSFYAFEMLYWCGIREGELLALTPADFDFERGTVSITKSYLALEDNYERIQKRSYRMFGTESIDNLRFAVMANTVDGGLEKQLEGFLYQYPDTRLIIIDTLQKVREASNECSYGNDYQVITRLKQFADSRGICMLIVHHTRKQKADDSFDMISGTNGLLGAADGAFLLKKEKRTENSATLEISGRDQQDQKLHLVRNPEKLSWELERVETELWKEPPEPILEAVAKFITTDNPDWVGTATELTEKIGTDIPVNAITKKLNVNASKLFNEYGIVYKSGRTHDGRRIELHFQSAVRDSS